MTADLLRVALGLVGLVLGANWLVRGSVSLAGRAGLSPLLIGLTVVAFGTSMPEVAVSLQAGLAGQGEIVLGNVLGSNVFNILVILGLSSLVAPLLVTARVIRVDAPLMVAACVLPVLLSLDGDLGRLDGVVLLVGLGAYLLAQARLAATEEALDAVSDFTLDGVGISVVLAVTGLILLGAGANQVVTGAANLARAAGVSELVVGLTVLAAGTSLPELATSVAATFQGERDLAVGNVLGSNVFNALGVLGIGAVAGPGIAVPTGVFTLDYPVMVGAALICLPILMSGTRIARGEGAVLVLYYVIYVTYLGLHTADHGLQEEFGMLALGVVLPLSLAVAGALYVRAAAEEKEGRGELPEGEAG